MQPAYLTNINLIFIRRQLCVQQFRCISGGNPSTRAHVAFCLCVSARSSEAQRGLTGHGDSWAAPTPPDLNNAGIWREAPKGAGPLCMPAATPLPLPLARAYRVAGNAAETTTTTDRQTDRQRGAEAALTRRVTPKMCRIEGSKTYGRRGKENAAPLLACSAEEKKREERK